MKINNLNEKIMLKKVESIIKMHHNFNLFFTRRNKIGIILRLNLK